MRYKIAQHPDATGLRPNVSQQTLAQYRAAAATLVGFCTDEVGSATPAVLVRWFCDQHGRWAYRTLGVYRAALRSWLVDRLARRRHTEAACEQLLAALEQGPRPLPRRGNRLRRTAAAKVREVSEEHARAIFAIAAAGSGRIDLILARFVKFDSYFGLRPGEWPLARVMRDRWLVVRNAKHSNNRGNGPYRVFDISGMTRADRAQIAQLIRLMREAAAAAGSWKKLNDQLGARLQRICRQLGIPRVCLYAFRGTASARRKARQVGRAEIAAFLGHASDASQRHYPSGRRLRGWTKAVPIMLPEERYVARVRARYRPPWEPTIAAVVGPTAGPSMFPRPV